MQLKKYTKKSLFGRLLIFLATIVWGSSFVVLKDTLSGIGGGHFTFFILALRFLIAAVCFFLISVNRLKNFNKSTIVQGVILGVILSFAYGFQTVGLKFTTESKNAFLTAVYCIVVPFFVWIIEKRKPKIKNYVAGVLCILGIAFVGVIGNSERTSFEALGNTLSVLCGVFYALQMIYNGKYVKENDPFLLLIIECFTCFVLFAVISGSSEFSRYHSVFSLSGEAIWKILYLGIFATCFAQFAQLFGQKFVSPTTTSIILSFEAVFGTVFELIFREEMNLTVFMIIGFLLIFLALIINEVGLPDFKRKRDKELLNE